ncbi:CLUMA_CG011835, isoform A, partial [Clunio marinus]
MANIPDLKEIAGKHFDIYEAYYRNHDPKNTNAIPAMDAARFLKKSGLSDVVLSKVWDLSDHNSKGYLDKSGFFVALKLVSLAQMGEQITVKNLKLETNAPKCGDVPKMKPPPVPKMIPVTATDWSIKPEERQKYQSLFNSLQPDNGVLPGNKVVGLLKDSKLPVDTLSTIWELADQDKDGSLDEFEFIVAMHLVYKALASRAIPQTLPKELQKPPKVESSNDFGAEFVANFPTDIVPVAPVIPPSRPPAPAMHPITAPLIPAIPMSSVSSGEWVLTTIEKLKYQELFEKSDMDKDGLVSGGEIKDVFLKSGLPQNMLAHIWALCDTHQSGKLNSEQFALACWLIDRKKKGVDPPQKLAPEMIPPSMRPNAGVVVQPPKPVYTNPELEMISKEIEELTKERHAIEAEVAQKEADIRIKTGEMRSLQSELDTLTATLKQLETQKEAAQKRLDDLKTQVNKLRDQCQKQEETIKEQEGELNSRKEELQKLKEEEHALQKEYDSSLKEKESISVQLQDTQLQISQVRAMVSQLEEIQRQMKDALVLCKAAVEENNATMVSDYSLNIEPEFRDFKKVLLSPEEKAKDAFNDSQSAFNDPPTGSKSAAFEDSFDNKSAGFGDDDSWHANSWNAQANDPFGGGSKPDPFAASNASPAKDSGKDAFGSDPFAILHAPPAGSSPSHPPESPSPALPPKKAKQPPPRPAPPRPSQGPKTDSFGSSSFANFDDFDIKVSSVAPEVTSQQPPKPMEQSNFNVTTPEVVASDFKEDPFQNYRYEDPFLISDPFQDEEVVVKVKEKESSSGFGFEADFGNFANFDAFNDNVTNNGNTGNVDAWGSLDNTNNNNFNDIKKTKVKKYNSPNKEDGEMR